MAKCTKSLSVAQLLVLSTAAQRPDRMIMPLPSGLRARGASQRTLLTSLLTLLLVEEVPTAALALSWREDAQGQHHALQLTAAGLNAVTSGLCSTVSSKNAQTANERAEIGAADVVPEPLVEVTPAAVAAPAGSCVPGGKLGGILEAVSAPAGATIDELVILTGWLPHTTRAALTRLRQRGYPLALVKQPNRKAYCLTQTGGA